MRAISTSGCSGPGGFSVPSPVELRRVGSATSRTSFEQNCPVRVGRARYAYQIGALLDIDRRNEDMLARKAFLGNECRIGELERASTEGNFW